MNLSDVLKEYFDEDLKSSPLIYESLGMFHSVPVQPQQRDDWEVVASPNRLNKTYEFEDSSTLKAFLLEMLDYQDSVSHHGKFIVDYLKVTVEIYTHDVDDVTELDLEWSKMADNIYQDVKDYAQPRF